MDKLSIAPMLDLTDRHCRVFHRLFSPYIRLYSEMIHAGAIIHGDRNRFLDFNAREHPIAIQLGGSDPQQLAEAANISEQWGYDEINLNVGCPSDKVQAGRFGACLMAEPELVGECVQAMSSVVSVPVTVKHRIGIDEQDAYVDLQRFIQVVSAAGCQQFIVHARKAWLKGLSPKQNRDVPPLDYGRVYQLADEFPALQFAINGGIKTLAEAKEHLKQVDSVMIGRAAYETPWMLAQTNAVIFNDSVPFQTRREIVEQYVEYLRSQQKRGVWLKHMVRHMMGLYHGQPGAKLWRRALAEEFKGPDAKVDKLFSVLDRLNA